MIEIKWVSKLTKSDFSQSGLRDDKEWKRKISQFTAFVVAFTTQERCEVFLIHSHASRMRCANTTRVNADLGACVV